MHVEEEVCQGALEPGAPTFINSESRPGDFRGGFEIQNSRAFTDLPMRLWLEIKLRRRAPAAHFLVVGCAGAYGNGRMRHVGNGEQQVALLSIEFINTRVELLNLVGGLLHFRDKGIGVLFFLLRSEEHTSELQSRGHLVCRLLL